MVRLIDADALKDYIDAQKGRPFIGCTIGEALKIMTDEQPTVDAVPVVRCKDCKYYEVGQNKVDAWSACYAHVGRIIETWDDNFCGWAERKEE